MKHNLYFTDSKLFCENKLGGLEEYDRSLTPSLFKSLSFPRDDLYPIVAKVQDAVSPRRPRVTL